MTETTGTGIYLLKPRYGFLNFLKLLAKII